MTSNGPDTATHLVSATFEERVRDLRPGLARKLSGEGTNAPQTQAVVDVLVSLLAYAWSVETILAAANKREGGCILGHAVSVRGYVDQVFSGDGPDVALERLSKYCRDAIRQLGVNVQSTQRALDDFAGQLAEKLKPARIEEDARVGGLLRLLGLREIAFWREFVHQYRTLDQQALQQIAKDRGASDD